MVSKKLIDQLFRGSRSAVAFPLRAIYLNKVRAEGALPVQVLVSVSKRHFKHAVDRNRIKRQIREAYRQHKQLLCETVPEDKQVLLAFVWLSNEHLPTQQVENRVVNLLQRVAEKL